MLDEIFAGMTAFGAVVTAGAVVIGVRQLRATERELELVQQELDLVQTQARTSFEDDLTREYRKIIGLLPAEAFYEDGDIELTDEYRRALYRYFDLSNEQLFLASQGRISQETEAQWRDGITGNLLRLPVFHKAWEEISGRVPDDFFEDLRKLVPPEDDLEE